jgi:hypothetical protein
MNYSDSRSVDLYQERNAKYKNQFRLYVEALGSIGSLNQLLVPSASMLNNMIRKCFK